MTLGGLVIAFAHRAASDFMSKSPKTEIHPHLLQVAIQFFRPTLPIPSKAVLTIRIANLAKASTTLHVELIQNNKACIAGYITMTNLSIPGQLSVKTGWQLSPPPVPTTTQSLEADCDPNWVSYLTPFSPTSLRRAQSYVKYYIPIKRSSLNYIDQWVTPGWKDEGAVNGAVWTNEIIHFVLDNCLPTLNDLLSTSKTELYQSIVRAGLVQRQARLEGKDDRIWGRGLTDSSVIPWIVSTIAISTEVKRLLPKDTKWLFMRVTTKSLLNDRMDYDVVLTDENGELIALSHHVMQVIHVDAKKAKLSSL